MWRIEFNEVAQADLLRLDKAVRERILNFFAERVAPHPLPQRIAEPLDGEFRGLHRFRIGNYRAVAHVHKHRVTVLVLFIDHRSKVYKRRSLPLDFTFPSDEEG